MRVVQRARFITHTHLDLDDGREGEVGQGPEGEAPDCHGRRAEVLLEGVDTQEGELAGGRVEVSVVRQVQVQELLERDGRRGDLQHTAATRRGGRCLLVMRKQSAHHTRNQPTSQTNLTC